MKIQFDHVGWITEDVTLFEDFWCKILEFKCFHQSSKETTEPLLKKVLDLSIGADIRKYKREDTDLQIEVYVPPYDAVTNFGPSEFQKGIHHVCLHVECITSFLESIPKNVTVNIYNNPGGWRNVFIFDFEGNRIEIRETLR